MDWSNSIRDKVKHNTTPFNMAGGLQKKYYTPLNMNRPLEQRPAPSMVYSIMVYYLTGVTVYNYYSLRVLTGVQYSILLL